MECLLQYQSHLEALSSGNISREKHGVHSLRFTVIQYYFKLSNGISQKASMAWLVEMA